MKICIITEVKTSRNTKSIAGKNKFFHSFLNLFINRMINGGVMKKREKYETCLSGIKRKKGYSIFLCRTEFKKIKLFQRVSFRIATEIFQKFFLVVYCEQGNKKRINFNCISVCTEH